MSRAHSVQRSAAAHAVFALVVAAVALVVLLIAGVQILWSALVALALGAGLSWLAHLRVDKRALRALGARPALPSEDARLQNVVDGLVVANGFRMPRLYLVDDGAPNIAGVGRTPKHSALVLTTGMLDRLSLVELEGALAHELSRIRERETLLAGTAAMLVGWLPESAARYLAGRMMEPTALVRADLAGVGLTRYPPGLAGALVSVRADGRTLKVNSRAYRHMWLAPPAGAIVDSDFSLEDRISVLNEL